MIDLPDRVNLQQSRQRQIGSQKGLKVLHQLAALL
jgi:hypothetical protein